MGRTLTEMRCLSLQGWLRVAFGSVLAIKSAAFRACPGNLQHAMSFSTDRSPWASRHLILELVKRELMGRYRNSLGGALWSFAQPLFLLAVYTVAFGVILKTPWGLSGDTGSFSLILFAGLIVFNAFMDCFRKAPTLVTGNPNFVKKVVFPLEILSWVQGLTALANVGVSLLVWVVAYAVLVGVPKLSVLYFPLILIAYFPLLLGVGWLLAALGVLTRDMDPFVSVMSHALLFLTPIFFSREAAPALLQHFLMLNPLTFIVEQSRRVLFTGMAPDFAGLALYMLLALLFSATSLYVFRRLRPVFGDLL
ncbi:MAG: transporter related (permease component) protein, partial [Rhodocyclales bacterium]|nr:transporter related (permease component) protein [Rhodocyclales bacterium]